MKCRDSIDALPLIAILRGFSRAQSRAIVSSLLRGGFRNIEITMDTRDAPEQIAEAREIAAERGNIGAGTVTNAGILEKALRAGAEFIVTPVLNLQIMKESGARGIPVFPGAFTATEIYTAWEAGACMVKVFPGETGGPPFIRALRGPFPALKLLPTGGITLETLSKYRTAGANGFGIGSPLLPRDRVEAKDWAWIEQRARDFVRAWEASHHI